MADRNHDLFRFYEILTVLEGKLGGRRKLVQCNGQMSWPHRGVYFFFERGETRGGTGGGERVVRVGTHALKQGSNTTLWKRLSQHRGTQKPYGGNHRGSVFRKHLGRALINRGVDLYYPSWGQRKNTSSKVRKLEQPMEALVSDAIGDMPFLWLDIDDATGRDSLRRYVECNAIALLSNFDKEPIDPPSTGWLGHHCPSARVQRSGLWNSNHVNDVCDDSFLERFSELVAKQGAK